MCMESIPVCMCDQMVSWWGQVDSFRHKSSCRDQGSSVILRGHAPGQRWGIQREAGQRGGITLLCVETLHMEPCTLSIRGLDQQLLRVTVSCSTLVLQPVTRWRAALYPSFLYAVLQFKSEQHELPQATCTFQLVLF